MRTSITLVAACLLAAGCGVSQDLSQTRERYEVDTSDLSVPSAAAFVQHARAIVDAGSGSFTIDELATLLPMDEDQRQLLRDAYPAVLSATCDAGRCTASGEGRAVEAILKITAGVIKDPLLGLNPRVTVQFVKRADNSLEVCNATGVYLRKSFIKKAVQGIYIDTTGEKLAVTVNVGNDSHNYTCD